MIDAADPMARDPSSLVTAVFRDIARTRMHGLPFLNEQLSVEAVSFAPWEGKWLGVLVTPWCMNLMLLPGAPDAWLALPQGEKRAYRFPAGTYEFIGADDPHLGAYAICSLFSPMDGFADQGSARLVAMFAREALFDPRHAAPVAPEPASVDAAEARPLSRRAFLGGGKGASG